MVISKEYENMEKRKDWEKVGLHVKTNRLLIVSLVFMGVGLIIRDDFPLLQTAFRSLGFYGFFVWINCMAEVKHEFPNAYKIGMALILGVSLVVCVFLAGNAWVNSSVWGGVGTQLDELVDSLIRLLEWLNENGFFSGRGGKPI